MCSMRGGYPHDLDQQSLFGLAHPVKGSFGAMGLGMKRPRLYDLASRMFLDHADTRRYADVHITATTNRSDHHERSRARCQPGHDP